jgi:hypothetical protein
MLADKNQDKVIHQSYVFDYLRTSYDIQQNCNVLRIFF